jgi:hypothetical protein
MRQEDLLSQPSLLLHIHGPRTALRLSVHLQSIPNSLQHHNLLHVHGMRIAVSPLGPRRSIPHSLHHLHTILPCMRGLSRAVNPSDLRQIILHNLQLLRTILLAIPGLCTALHHLHIALSRTSILHRGVRRSIRGQKPVVNPPDLHRLTPHNLQLPFTIPLAIHGRYTAMHHLNIALSSISIRHRGNHQPIRGPEAVVSLELRFIRAGVRHQLNPRLLAIHGMYTPLHHLNRALSSISILRRGSHRLIQGRKAVMAQISTVTKTSR